MGEILPDGSIQGYTGICQKCGKNISVNMQGNNIYNQCLYEPEKHDNKPELLGEATELNPDMETIEQAAIRIVDATWDHPLDVDVYKCFDLGASYAAAKEREVVIEEVITALTNEYKKYSEPLPESTIKLIKSLSTKK